MGHVLRNPEKVKPVFFSLGKEFFLAAAVLKANKQMKPAVFSGNLYLWAVRLQNFQDAIPFGFINIAHTVQMPLKVSLTDKFSHLLLLGTGYRIRVKAVFLPVDF